MKLALEYLDEEARITVIELDDDGFVHLWYPSFSPKEFSGKKVYISLVKEVINVDDLTMSGERHMYQHVGSMKHDDCEWGYEMIEELDPMRNPIGAYEMIVKALNLLEEEHVAFKGKNDALSANTV